MDVIVGWYISEKKDYHQESLPFRLLGVGRYLLIWGVWPIDFIWFLLLQFQRVVQNLKASCSFPTVLLFDEEDEEEKVPRGRNFHSVAWCISRIPPTLKSCYDNILALTTVISLRASWNLDIDSFTHITEREGQQLGDRWHCAQSLTNNCCFVVSLDWVSF